MQIAKAECRVRLRARRQEQPTHRPSRTLVTLQTQFAQDQMQAFAAQTQELHKLIGEALQKLPRG